LKLGFSAESPPESILIIKSGFSAIKTRQMLNSAPGALIKNLNLESFS
jgi:hypothetical protein